jgi:hypothetical protein
MPDGIVLGQVTNCADDIGKDYDVRFAAVGDAKLVLRQLIEEFKRQDGPKVRGDGNGIVKRVASVRDEYAAQWEPRLRSEEVPISPYRVFRELETAFDISKTIMTHDSGYPRDQLVPTWKSVTPRSYIGWGKSTQLGYGLGLSIGAKLAAPDRQVINIMGDAAFGMTGLDIETAVRAEVPILTVVLNNGVMTNYDSYMPEATARPFSAGTAGGAPRSSVRRHGRWTPLRCGNGDHASSRARQPPMGPDREGALCRLPTPDAIRRRARPSRGRGGGRSGTAAAWVAPGALVLVCRSSTPSTCPAELTSSPASLIR